MSKLQTLTDSLLKRTINHMLEKELSKWPPDCPGLFAQPLRPYNKLEVIASKSPRKVKDIRQLTPHKKINLHAIFFKKHAIKKLGSNQNFTEENISGIR